MIKKWPAVTPEKVVTPINLKGPPPDPVTFDGPLNLFIALHGVAQASINAAHTKQEYDDVTSSSGPPQTKPVIKP